MTVGNCFWSLLEKDSFKFLYIPTSVGNLKLYNGDKSISDVLLHRSLFDIMHPNEIELAKKDLARFLQLKVLAGSVTRCRLLSPRYLAVYLSSKTMQPSLNLKMTSIDENQNNLKDTAWNIVDLVLYTVTENTVLAFFHNFDLSFSRICNITQTKPTCNDDHESFIQEDAINLLRKLEPTNKVIEPNQKLHLSKDDIIPLQIFQVIDKLTKKRIVVWPQLHSLERSLVDMILTKTHHIELKEFKSSSYSDHLYGRNTIEYISCSRHFYANSKIEILDNYPCNFQRILIPYGNIIFESIQLTECKHCSLLPSMLHLKGNPSINSPEVLRNDSKKIENYSGANLQCHENQQYNGSLLLKSQNFIQDQYLLVPTGLSGTVSTVEAETLHGLNGTTDAHTFVEPETQLWLDTKQISSHPTHVGNNSIDNMNCSDLVGYPMFQKFRIKRYENQDDNFSASTSESAEKRRKLSFLYKQLPPGAIQKFTKTCARCQTTNSPEWRRGPDGNKTLCNACGLRYSRYRSKQWNTASKQ